MNPADIQVRLYGETRNSRPSSSLAALDPPTPTIEPGPGTPLAWKSLRSLGQANHWYSPGTRNNGVSRHTIETLRKHPRRCGADPARGTRTEVNSVSHRSMATCLKVNAPNPYSSRSDSTSLRTDLALLLLSLTSARPASVDNT